MQRKERKGDLHLRKTPGSYQAVDSRGQKRSWIIEGATHSSEVFIIPLQYSERKVYVTVKTAFFPLASCRENLHLLHHLAARLANTIRFMI